MSEEQATGPQPAPPSKPRPTWRRALSLVRANPAATMLPLTVIQLPLGLIAAGVYFYLYYEVYPEADFESFSRFEDSPSSLFLALILMTAVYLLFTLVGAAATIVAVKNLLDGRPVRLAESLDPAFTRMGGLLVIGALFYLLMLATVAGIIVVLYFVIRWGLAVHAHVLEGTSVGGSLGSSWRSLKGRMLSFTGLLLTALPVGLIVFTVASIVFAIILTPFSAEPGRTVTLLAQSIGILVFGIVTIPTGAYLGAATTIFYVSAKEHSGA